MKNLLLLLLITSLLLEAKTVTTKVMHGQNRDEGYHRTYSHSSPQPNREDDVLCSTVDATAQISVMIAVQLTSEATSQGSTGNARLSYLDNNRVEITEDIAKGEGEHLETLLSMINPHYKRTRLVTIQEHFDELIYLDHSDFLKRVTFLIS